LRRRASLWLPPALWAAGLLWLGSRRPGQLPSSDLPAGADKVAHFAFYAVLGLLLQRAWRSRRPLLVGALAGALVGVLDEWIQSRVPGRDPDLFDLVADLLGAATGAWLAARALRRLKSPYN
jgi:VanZ family protein